MKTVAETVVVVEEKRRLLGNIITTFQDLKGAYRENEEGLYQEL